MNIQFKKWKRLIKYISIIVFLSLIIWAIISYASLATLTIITDTSITKIFVHEDKPHPRNIDINQKDTQATVKLEAGDYTITVQSGNRSTAQVITLSAGQSKSLKLMPETAAVTMGSTTPVTSMGASDYTLSDNGDSLLFVDKNDATTPLYKIDSQNHISVIDKKHTFTTVRWSDYSYGIGLTTDSNDKPGLVKIENNSVTDIPLPFSSPAIVEFSLAPNRTLYVSDTHNIYKAGPGEPFTQVYKTEKSNVHLSSAGNSDLLFTETANELSREGNLNVLHSDGKKNQTEGEAYNSAWSPSGSKLVTSGDVSEIFDNKLNVIKTLPQGNFTSPRWLDDSTLLYAIGSDVWKYDLQSGKSTILVAINSTIGAISGMRPDGQGNLYITIYTGRINNTLQFRLDRISLAGNQTQASNIIQQFAALFPETNNGCQINFINFTKLDLVTKGSSNEICTNYANSFLYGHGVPLRLYNIDFQRI